MRATVTGAGGFIGSHLVGFLKRRGCWVRGVDLVPPAYAPTEADEFLLLDLTDSSACLRAAGDTDVFFALAANMGGIGWTHAAPAEILRDNLLISTNSLEACRRRSVGVVVYASSACVYPLYLQDRPDSPPLREDSIFPADPDREYGWEKLTTEILATSYRAGHGVDVKVARLHAIYGPLGTYTGLRAKSLAMLCGKVAAVDGPSGEIKVWGDGTQTRSYCYIDDCLEGLWRIAHSDLDTPVNLGSDERVSIAELVQRIARIAGKQIVPRYQPDRPVGPLGRCSDNTLCQQRLGWTPTTQLEKGLSQTYEWIAERVRSEGADVPASMGASGDG
jgi:nucleoside-diphosphate-sugar epimerase